MSEPEGLASLLASHTTRKPCGPVTDHVVSHIRKPLLSPFLGGLEALHVTRRPSLSLAAGCGLRVALLRYVLHVHVLKAHMSRKRSPARPAPWARTGWKAAPNALTPEQVRAAMDAPVASQGPLEPYVVGVYPSNKYAPRKYVAYTSLIMRSGGCQHTVTAANLDEAKAVAIEEHAVCCTEKG